METTKFVGCYKTRRRCYHCGWEWDYLVVEGKELTHPNPTDYCTGYDQHQQRGGIHRNQYYYDYKKISSSILKGD